MLIGAALIENRSENRKFFKITIEGYRIDKDSTNIVKNQKSLGNTTTLPHEPKKPNLPSNFTLKSTKVLRMDHYSVNKILK